MVRWASVYQPTALGGLGIRSINNVNKALLQKWLWRVREPGQGLWKNILISKYKLSSDGWCVLNLAYKVSGLWTSVLPVKDDFVKQIQYTVHDGQRVRFWHD